MKLEAEIAANMAIHDAYVAFLRRWRWLPRRIASRIWLRRSNGWRKP